MLYLVGGAPRTGKSILGQRFAAQLKIGWVSTDILVGLLRVKNEEGVKTSWNATPEAITADADWFFPYLERFVWGITSHAASYVIEGVDFLPTHVKQLSEQYSIRSVFLGCSKMTLERFDKYPGHSPGYSMLPKDIRQQFAHDIPFWSKYVQQEAKKHGYSFVDMSDNFQLQLNEAEVLLKG